MQGAIRTEERAIVRKDDICLCSTIEVLRHRFFQTAANTRRKRLAYLYLFP